MASSPVKFLFLLLLFCIVGWVVFMFAARLVAWLISRMLGANVGFRIAGCNSLRDVVVKFKKGAVESVSVGEIKLSLRKSLVKLGVGFVSKDPKLQLLICDLEVTLRQSEKKTKKTSSQKSHSSRSSGRGKWMVFANVARFLSVSVTDLVVKMPKAIIEVRDLGLDLFKNGGSNPVLNVKLHLLPLLVHLGESRLSYDQSGCLLEGQAFSANTEKNSAPIICDELLIISELGHDREMGIGLKNVDVTSGVVSININEDMFLKIKMAPDSSPVSDISGGDNTIPQKSQKDKNSVLSLKKHLLVFPEKVSFNLPKLDMRFMHQGQDFCVENNIMGINLRSSKSLSSEDSGESAFYFDIRMDFSEIHLLREGQSSVMEILKVAVVTSVDVPFQLAMPIRTEIDVKLGGTQFNLIVSRLMPLLRLKQSKKSKITLREENYYKESSQVVKTKAIMWTCTVSAPEMTIVLYSLKGLLLYHGCSQSSHLFANNIACKGMQVHAELGELHLHVADEHHECFKENLFGIETNSGSLVHIARVSLDWGHKEMETREDLDSNNLKSIFSVDITGMGIYFNFQHVETLVTTAVSFKSLLRSLTPVRRSSTHSKTGRSNKKGSEGTQIIKLNLEQCSVIFSGDVGIEEAIVADPKRVNYGSQGGEIIFSVSSDGTTRQAHITSTTPDGSKLLKNATSLDIFHLSLTVNKEKQTTQMELERARSFYKEYYREQDPCTTTTLLDIQNAKFVRRPGGLNETSICSLFSATDIAVRWEPDVHVALYELMLRIKFLIHKQKFKGSDSEVVEALEPAKDSTLDSLVDKQHRKKETVFAVDVEMLRVSAELADGVEAMIQVQSIFSENARIGILLEGLGLSFNECRVFKSSRMQISRLPILSPSSIDAKAQVITRWDWVIQGLDIHICMPYRLQLRAIEDAVEDTLRGLKLIITSRANILFPVKDGSKKVKTKASKFGSVRFNIRKLTADIEEEPIQGWLDEHYQLMKSEICELNARLKFLDDTRSLGVETNEMFFGKKIQHGVDIDVQDESAIQKLREEIHEKSFRSYYSACQKLAYSEGSGACRNDFQAGFKPSKNRASLLALCATELDVTLTAIDGADSGMIEFVKKCDAVALDNNIPFSRLYGRDLVLRTGSLVAQLRNYTFPLFSGTAGKCEGRVVFAQQATCFQPQIEQDVYIGKWRKIRMLRSASGTTPAMKMYSNLPIIFQKGELCFGVGFEPVFADISYAFTVALRRANLGFRNPMVSNCQPPKKERSLPWWDDMRYYIHGKIGLSFAETIWNVLATPNPYEKLDKLQIVSGYMDIQQSDGRVHLSAKEFKVFISSLESLISSCSLKNPAYVSTPFLDSPSFSLEVGMDWECDSGNPLDHYLHALPVEGKIQDKVYDPFRSTSLSLKWNFSLKPSPSQCDKHDTSSSIADGGILHGAVYGNSQKSESALIGSPKMNLGAHDLVWLLKFWNMNYNPPHKLRSFSRWPRFGVPRAARSGNLSLDKVMTEFFLRLDSTPASIRHMPLGDDDPASGLTFTMTKMKYELCFSRGKQRFTFDCKREPLDLVYQGLDMHLLKAYLNRDADKIHQDSQSLAKNSQSAIADRINSGRSKSVSGCADKSRDVGFLLHSDFFSIRKQAPKADPARLLAWQDPGRRNLEMTYVRSEFENGSESDHAKSDPSDDDGFNVVIADNCQRVFVYGLKLLWTLENRDAVWSWVGGISKAFEPPKPSPSRQYAQRRLAEEQQIPEGSDVLQDDLSNSLHSSSQGANPSSPQNIEVMASHSSGSPSTKMEISSGGIEKDEPNGVEEEGTRHFMVNVVQPQFNLHSEEANGRFLLAAASGRVLARSFHSIVHVGYEMIEKTLGTSVMKIPESEPEMTWKRAEFSVMLEHVQSHVAPTDVDPGAGLQWLPKIRRHYPEVKRTGALLERVFMPCQMYFRYTRHKGASADLKVKPLKELTFNSPNITATMTSRQFQVMLDVLSNLLFARLPKPRKNNLSYPNEDDDVEEADEVVPDGVEEVELARIKLEQNERDRRLLVYDIRTILSSSGSLDISSSSPEKESNFWMITGGRSTLVQGLKKELASTQKSKKAASIELRMALQKAAQLHLMEKEKNKSPSYAMRISMKINKVVWSMISDGKLFAEAEINNMVYDFDRDYKDIGVAKFTTKSFEVRNCMPNTKSGMLLAPWNAPPEWGKNVMLRVDAKQGAPKDGSSRIEKFQVEIHPLRIHLTETMYRMMWEYFFPEEEQDSHRRQEVWKVSTTAGSRRSRKSASGSEFGSSNHSVKESEAPSRLNATTSTSSASGVNASHAYPDSQVSKLQNLKANIVCGSTPELRRTSSFDRTWEENVAESVADEIVLQIHSSSKSGPLDSTLEHPYSVNEKTSKVKPKDSKSIKLGRLSHEEKKIGKSQDEKRVRVRKMMEFHDIKIGQVELLVTYEGSRFPVNDLRLLMDTFHQDEFTGTWRRLFSRVKKHIIWGVLKSVTGMQGKKFKDKAQSQRETSVPSVPSIDLNFSDSDGDQPGKSDEYPISWLKRPNDGAGDGFVTSIKGLFNSQRRRAKAFVLRTMRGDQDSEFQGEWSESDAEFSPFARQLTITKARKLIRHHTKKFRSRGQKASGSASQQRGSLPSSPRETPFQSDSSGASSPYEDFHE